MTQEQSEMTLVEAIKRFPGLLDEIVRFGSMDTNDIRTATKVTLQFVGDNNYRTQELSSRTDARD